MLRKVLILSGLFASLSGSMVTADDLFSGIDPDGFDRSVRPQDDLYQHVNGRWLLSTQIPEDKSNYGSFTALDDAARENIRSIIEESAKTPRDENSQKVGDFYRSFMNEDAIRAAGMTPLAEDLAAIARLNDMEDVFRHLGTQQKIGVGGPVGFFVDADPKDSNRHLAAVVQSGTTLPDRDYYLEDEEKYRKAREALKAYITELFRLAESSYGAEEAEQILALETRLAEAQWTKTELRDANKRYNKYQVEDLSTLTPALPWPIFFEAAGVPDLKEVNVMTPSFFEGLETIADETDVQVAKAYLTFHLLDSAAPYLTPPFVNAHFELHDRELAGIPQQQPRWKRAVDATGGAGAGDFGVLGEAVGQLYVEQHFRPEAKERMDELVSNLMKAYESSIGKLTWMTDETKQKALQKLQTISPKIGYPVKWRDYSRLEISPDDLLGNLRRSAEFEHQRMIDKLNEPVDRTEWGMTPQTVNAYYNPSQNEIVFPGAILQPPFFTADADDAANYGGIGAVIGHEISHGFDDQGSKYDADGNLVNWWTDKDRAAFEALAGKLVSQFENYEALPGKKLNGQLTLGENIADLSGMAIALKAYQLSLKDKPAPVIDGQTGVQRFFFGWAQIWRRLYREEELIRRLVIDPHSPSAFRANGPVSNLDAFYDAFDVKPGDKLYKAPADRIQIW
ncbi:MAG: M13-type metalloendopeptidase [Planctomycetaceae bacterium]